MHYSPVDYYRLGQVYPRSRLRERWVDHRRVSVGWKVYLSYGRSSVGTPFFAWVDSYVPGSSLSDAFSAGANNVAQVSPGDSQSEGIG